jgi:GDPmannose 4,6-dehydratase
MKQALICGVSGQDGAYLAQLLLEKGYAVCGTSRDAQMSSFKNLVTLEIKDRVKLESMALTDFRSVLQVLKKIKPDEIYNLAGQSSVGLSFEQPVETLESVATGTLNLLEAMRFIDMPIKLYSAGSSECFGDTGEQPADELTPFRPRSPYAVAKSAAFWELANYREAYGLFACSGILFNHESILRPERFVTQKIVAAARRIANGDRTPLYLGNLAVRRDWGWAPEYVEAMYLMLQQEQPDDYVIATGESYTLEDFVSETFAAVGLEWQAHVSIEQSLFRPTDLAVGLGNPAKAKLKLGWEAKYQMPDVVKMMMSQPFYQNGFKPQNLAAA